MYWRSSTTKLSARRSTMRTAPSVTQASVWSRDSSSRRLRSARRSGARLSAPLL
jgi:hypothetical protein